MVQAQINPLPKNKPMSGTFRLTGLDLSVARPFVPMVEKLTGRLNGSGTISGGLLAPLVNGTVQLSDGEVSGAELPMELQDLQLTALIAGESRAARRRLEKRQERAGQPQRATSPGVRRWWSTWRCKGTQLPVTVEPYAKLEVAPDLKISMAGDKLAIAGKVQVPERRNHRARIAAVDGEGLR